MSVFSAKEADFLSFVRRHSDELDAEWAEIAQGSLDINQIVSPLYERLSIDSDQAQGLASAYSSDFVSYVRSRNGDVDAKMRSLSALAARAGMEIDDRFFAGRFPTHSFNAQAVREGDTFLLLVHTGFERLMIESSRLIFAIHHKLAPARVERWAPEPSWWATAGLDQLLDNLADLLASFIVDPEPVPRYLDEDEFPFEPERELPAFAAGAAGQDFALAHELGHFVLGHLHAEDGRHLRKLRSGLDVLPKHIREEHEADIFAGQLLACSRPESEVQNVLDMIYGKYVGIGLFFELDGLLAEIERRAFDLPVSNEGQSHPPARKREAVLLSAIRHEITNRHLFADRRTIGRTFRKVREEVLERALLCL